MQKLFDGKTSKNALTKFLPLDKKLLHHYLLKNVIPRQEHRDTVAIGYAILMEKIVSGERVNLSAIILGHMQYCQSHDTHALPFPHVIKKLLTKLNLYPYDVSEKRTP